jgi:hypothetical protein
MVLISIQVQLITATGRTSISYRRPLPNDMALLRSYLPPEVQILSQGKTLIASLNARLCIGIFKMVTLFLSIGRYISYFYGSIFFSINKMIKKDPRPRPPNH